MLFNTISVHNLTNELCRIYMPIVIFLRCNDGNTNINGWTLMLPLGSALQTVKIQTDQSKQNSALRAQLLVRAITLYFFIYGTMIASVCTGICPSRAHKEVFNQSKCASVQSSKIPNSFCSIRRRCCPPLKSLWTGKAVTVELTRNGRSTNKKTQSRLLKKEKHHKKERQWLQWTLNCF